MDETETKPKPDVFTEEMRPILRLAFNGNHPVDPPAIVRVPRDGVRFGRQVSVGVQLEDVRVSRHHATIQRNIVGLLSIVDEQSKNGTFVNGERVSRRDLQNGDVISIGDSCLVVAAEPTETAEATPAELVGDSAAMRRARSLIRLLGPSPHTVLLVAETGCGKEVVARALHAASGLPGRPFVAVNCAAVPESLFESQLFGHTSKAFTGAVAHDGFFRAAMHGTLFLDEIGELPLALQAKLLRAIQERAVVPLGATRPIPCPVRIIAATNRELAAEVERGRFRGDLLARLFEERIELPPLRERREDVLPLFVRGLRDSRRRITHALAEALLLHDWPFNVRELLACAREASNTDGDKQPLDLAWFRRRIEGIASRSRPIATTGPAGADAIDADELKKLLSDADGNVAEVARKLLRSRKHVYRWIQRHGLRVGDFRH